MWTSRHRQRWVRECSVRSPIDIRNAQRRQACVGRSFLVDPKDPRLQQRMIFGESMPRVALRESTTNCAAATIFL